MAEIVTPSRLSSRLSYSKNAKIGHWAIAVLVAVQYYAAVNMGEHEPGMEVDAFSNLHVTVGPMILILAAWRLIARFTDPVAQLPDIPRWQQVVASITHTLLYAILVVMPLGGLLAAANEGANFRFFAIIPVPRLVAPGSALGELGELAHVTAAPILLALILLHIAAALYHLLIRRDRVMQRMLPERRA
jgi:cytochrome b561